MINTTEIIKIILLFVTLIIMGIGVKTDTQERKYPNSILMATLVIGLVYATISGHVLESLLGFLVVNIFGILLYKYNLMAPGDMKFLSTLFMFVNIRDVRTCLILIAYMLVVTLIIGIGFYKRIGKNIGEEFRKELFSYKALLIYRINTFATLKFENKEEMLGKTIAFTLPMYISFILTIISVGIISFI